MFEITSSQATCLATIFYVGVASLGMAALAGIGAAAYGFYRVANTVLGL